MNEDIQLALDEAKNLNQKAVDHLKSELQKIRAGKANPSMLEGVMVDYYGSQTPINQVANVNSTDGRTLTVQPWEKAMLDEISKAILNANLGLNPQNNGDIIIINIPPLTEERRKELVKKARSEGENAKVSIRNNRKEANDLIKSLKDEGVAEDIVKLGEDEVQKLTDTYSKRVDDIISNKEEDILKI